MAEEVPGPELVNDPSEIDWHVSPAIRRSIGSAVVACSYLEHTLEIAIWAFLKLNSEDGKMLTSRMDMNRRQSLIRELIDRYPKEGTSIALNFWEILQAVIESRNKVVHGVWITARGSPAIASTKWRKYKDHMSLDIFEYEKLYALEQLATNASVMLRDYMQQIELPHLGFSVPPRPGVSIRQAYRPEPHIQTEPQPPPKSSAE